MPAAFEDLSPALLAPALVVLAWLLLWVSGRPVGWRFFVAAAAVAVLSVPAAVLIAYLQPPCNNPSRETWACGYSVTFTNGVLSALLTAGYVVALLLLTAFLKIFGLGPGEQD